MAPRPPWLNFTTLNLFWSSTMPYRKHPLGCYNKNDKIALINSLFLYMSLCKYLFYLSIKIWFRFFPHYVLNMKFTLAISAWIGAGAEFAMIATNSGVFLLLNMQQVWNERCETYSVKLSKYNSRLLGLAYQERYSRRLIILEITRCT